MRRSEEAILAYKGMAFDTIKETLGEIYEYCGSSEQSDSIRKYTIAEISGVIRMTEMIIEGIEKCGEREQ